MNLQWLENLAPEARFALLTEAEKALSYDRLAEYRPYPKQRRFHALGATHRERLLRAGNQNGKSYCAGHELAFHVTGEYPADWEGKRFDHPILAWASGETAEATRDNPQRVLIGEIGEWGSGAIPKRCLGDKGTASGTADLLDYVRVRHVSGGWSTLRFKYYAQGRRKWQGPKVYVVWFDEEPPAEIYDEGLARTIASGGIAMLSFTPLMGMSEVVRRFLMEQSKDRADVNMTIADAEHITAEQRAVVIASFPKHEREAREKGIPTMGSGRIFPVEESLISIAPFQIPAFWPRICGLDFGWTHPTAAAWLAWDRDTDTVYVTDVYRRSEVPVAQHASTIKSRGSWIPVAWPHDGNNDTAAGPQLAKQYRDEGVAMRPTNAQFAPHKDDDREGSLVSVEAGLSEMLTRMESGRFKVFSHLNDWFDEFRLYHREDGKIVKKMDDLMSATRYGIMDLRFAIVKPERRAVASSFIPLDPTVGY